MATDHRQSRRWPLHLHRRCRSSVRRHSNSCFSPPTCSGCWSSPRTRHLHARPRTQEGHYSQTCIKDNLHVPAFGVRSSPLYSIHTMMSPFWSLVVSFWYCSFQVTTCTAPECISPKFTSLQSAFFSTLDAQYSRVNKTDLPLWPSRVWFMDRLLGAARPLTLASSTDNEAKINRYCSWRNSKKKWGRK